MPLLISSVLRVVRDRTASWKFGRAGVDGLLALPLFVVTVTMVDCADGVESLLRSISSALLSLRLAFVLGVAAGLSSTSSSSFWGGSVFTTTAGSFVIFESGLGRGQLLLVLVLVLLLLLLVVVVACAISGVVLVLPFVLVAAEDGGLAFVFSEFDCIEFCLARDDDGRGGTGPGTGDGLLGTFDSGKVPRTGDEVADGDMVAAMPFL